MGIRYGGAETPRDNGLRMSVEAPDGVSTSAPVNVGDLFKLGGTDLDGSGYKVAALTAGEDPTEVVMVQALERKTEESVMTVAVLGPYSQIRRIPYKTGSAPTVGQSIETATASVREVVGIAFKYGGGFVLYVDTVNEEVEVLI